MTIRTPFRTLTLAAMVSLTLLSVPVSLAHAAVSYPDKKSCEAAGYKWHDEFKACGGTACPPLDLDDIYRTPGSVRVVNGRWMVCDGVTGTWVPARTAPPVSPVKAPSTTMAP